MGRISPESLLHTLKDLLTPSGGLRQDGEHVDQIAELMKKFSKKLVLKCIYIRILMSTDQDLLQEFLARRGGWVIVRSWLGSALETRNWSLCQQLVTLLSVCPVPDTRLAEELLERLQRIRGEPAVRTEQRNLVVQVTARWRSVLTAPLPAEGTLQDPLPAGITVKVHFVDDWEVRHHIRHASPIRSKRGDVINKLEKERKRKLDEGDEHKKTKLLKTFKRIEQKNKHDGTEEKKETVRAKEVERETVAAKEKEVTKEVESETVAVKDKEVTREVLKSSSTKERSAKKAKVSAQDIKKKPGQSYNVEMGNFISEEDRMMVKMKAQKMKNEKEKEAADVDTEKSSHQAKKMTLSEKSRKSSKESLEEISSTRHQESVTFDSMLDLAFMPKAGRRKVEATRKKAAPREHGAPELVASWNNRNYYIYKPGPGKGWPGPSAGPDIQSGQEGGLARPARHLRWGDQAGGQLSETRLFESDKPAPRKKLVFERQRRADQRSTGPAAWPGLRGLEGPVWREPGAGSTERAAQGERERATLPFLWPADRARTPAPSEPDPQVTMAIRTRLVITTKKHRDHLLFDYSHRAWPRPWGAPAGRAN